jgi:hypothetical protein
MGDAEADTLGEGLADNNGEGVADGRGDGEADTVAEAVTSAVGGCWGFLEAGSSRRAPDL